MYLDTFAVSTGCIFCIICTFAVSTGCTFVYLSTFAASTGGYFYVFKYFVSTGVFLSILEVPVLFVAVTPLTLKLNSSNYTKLRF